MLPFRALGTTYTNGTGREITINVTASSTATAAIVITLGSGLAIRGQAGSAGLSLRAAFQIPNGESYTATVSIGTGTLLEWQEYR